MSKLRKLARGQECQLRLFDDHGNRICNGDSNTVVLCHIRRGCVGGIGRKPHDLVGVYACSSCHDVLDGRVIRDVSDLDTQLLEGLCRTLEMVGREVDL